MKRVFVDSSVLFTAVNSPTGGSAKLFTLKKLSLITSKVVLTEVERNIRKKLADYHLKRYFVMVGKIEIIDQEPDDNLIKRARKVIVEKDAVILAEAKQAKAHILVTLDRKHFLKEDVFSYLKPQKVMTPKMLLESLK
ncbi:PIN domain-containing protein [Candidatus Gottesmanbacteria bacterium]|nr:PIN domain-containing protein [Candidatus Gottesmanbacteria bacterium]